MIENVLPYDGLVSYFPDIFKNETAISYFDLLQTEIRWEFDVVKMFGKTITTRRKVAWYGDDNLVYRYSQVDKKSIAWSPLLLQIKREIELVTGHSYNSCLLNLYHSGLESMGWHSDNEKELKKNGAIASVSFGANRKFYFKHKLSKEKVELLLENGSVLLMHGNTQENWQHSLPLSKLIITPRINLTFRTIA